MSQKAISDALSKKTDLENSEQTIRAGVTWTNDIYLGDEKYKISFNNNGDLTYNGDKVMVGSTVSNEVLLVQNIGQSTTSVMSQKAVTDALSTKVDKTDITQSTGTSETAVMSQKAVSDALSELEDDIEVVVEKTITPNVIEGLAVKNSNLVKADATKKTFYIQGKEGQSITIYFADITDTTSFYFGFADGIPVAELPITDYKTSNPSETLRKFVFPRDCYLLVSCSKTNSCYYIEKKQKVLVLMYTI